MILPVLAESIMQTWRWLFSHYDRLSNADLGLFVLRELGPVALPDRGNNLTDETVDLLGGTADVSPRVERLIDVHFCEGGIVLQTIDEIVCASVLLDLPRGLLAVNANPLMQLLPVAAGPHASHQNLFRRHEWQLFLKMLLDHL